MAPSESGPNVVGRVGALLRAVGETEPTGASTTHLARATDLARPTAHRILSALATEGLVDRDVKTGRWSLGPEMYLLGSVAANRYDITELAQTVIHRLTSATGESAFLSARRGDETVCIIRQDGSFPLRSHVLHEGIRLPLGVASAGLAILAHLPTREIDDYLGRVELSEQWGPDHDADPLRARIADTLRTGYAVNPALLIEGSWGIGAAVFDRAGKPAWALSLTGVETRFRPERHHELGTLLLEQAHVLSGLLSQRAT